MSQPTGVLLVGSLPFESGEEVFSKSCRALPERLTSVPDGETGIRQQFTVWQQSVFPKEILGPFFRDSEPPADKDFDCKLEHIKPTQYDTAASASYQAFCRLRNEGAIPPTVRFQVSLPGIFSVINPFIDAKYQAQVKPLYEQRMLEDIEQLLKLIPATDLAVQFDLAVEIGILEYSRGRVPPGLPPAFFKPCWSDLDSSFKNVVDGTIRLAERIDPAIPLGFHLCYGDIANEHWMQPRDLRLLVQVANGLIEGLKPSRRVHWIHMPCPKDRTDAAYYEPLGKLSVAADTKLYLGLVHSHDEHGTRKRIAAAQSAFQGNFGVATECGMGRTPRENVDSIFDILRAVTGPADARYSHEQDF